MDDLYSHISLTIKTLRQERGWSLDKAAQATGVSKAMLGQIERKESSPTIATLWKIATGFQTSFSSFIANINTNFSEPIYSAAEMHQIDKDDEKIRVMPLFPFDSELNCDIFIVDLLPGCEHMSPPHKQGVVEHVIIAEGTMDVIVNGAIHSLNKGNGLRFNADQPHGYRNTGTEVARYHNVIHYPKAL